MIKKAILFDLDGTLIHTLPDLTDGINYMLQGREFSEVTEAVIHDYIGDGIYMLIKRVLPVNSSEEEIKKGIDEFRKYYSVNMANKSRPYPGVVEITKQLKKEGYLLGVITNKLDSAAKLLCNQFYPHFDIVIGNTEKFKPKPDPSMVEYIIEQLGTDKKSVIFIGDSDVDVKTATDADIPCITITWGYRSKEQLKAAGAKYFAADANELYNVVKEILN
ncbi:MAG: hypothetical protein A2Y17_13135 [Clostridiales bacterium GWF2_38_85]|nr:MAG: hypothetical protein A2Y17_13135 [Clostridiales bacterium GWF2_38_85]